PQWPRGARRAEECRAADHEGEGAGSMTAAATLDPAMAGDAASRRLLAVARLVWLLAALFAAGILWAWLAELDEVATGSGRVVPSSHEQVVQSLEGGILEKLLVRQDSILEPGQILAPLEPTQAGSTVEESAAKYRAALAASARLRAEVNQPPLVFPAELDDFPDLKAEETRLFEARRRSLASSTS